MSSTAKSELLRGARYSPDTLGAAKFMIKTQKIIILLPKILTFKT